MTTKMDGEISCDNCNWRREQGGSCHYICPKCSDFSSSTFAPKCDIFIPRTEEYNPKCNAFMVWDGSENPWPDTDEMKRLHQEIYD